MTERMQTRARRLWWVVMITLGVVSTLRIVIVFFPA